MILFTFHGIKAVMSRVRKRRDQTATRGLDSLIARTGWDTPAFRRKDPLKSTRLGATHGNAAYVDRIGERLREGHTNGGEGLRGGSHAAPNGGTFPFQIGSGHRQ